MHWRLSRSPCALCLPSSVNTFFEKQALLARSFTHVWHGKALHCVMSNLATASLLIDHYLSIFHDFSLLLGAKDDINGFIEKSIVLVEALLS